MQLPVRLGAALVALTLLAVGPASAASLTVSTSTLGAEQVPVVRCDTTVSVSWTTEFDTGLGAFTVDIVTLENIAGTCDAAVLQVTLADGSNAALGSGSYTDAVGATGQIDPGAGGSQTVAFDFSGQEVLASAVVASPWSIAQ